MRLLDSRQALLDRMRSREEIRGQGYDSVGRGSAPVNPMSATDARIDAEGPLLEEMERLRAEVDEAREVCARIRVIDPSSFGGGLIDLHYFGLLPWRDAAASMGVSETTARREVDRAYRLIDDVGIPRILHGWSQDSLPL